MKTPYAILIGLALIAAAIFYREPSVSAAQAGAIKTKYMDGFKCVASDRDSTTCAILHGNQITFAHQFFSNKSSDRVNDLNLLLKKTFDWR